MRPDVGYIANITARGCSVDNEETAETDARTDFRFVKTSIRSWELSMDEPRVAGTLRNTSAAPRLEHGRWPCNVLINLAKFRAKGTRHAEEERVNFAPSGLRLFCSREKCIPIELHAGILPAASDRLFYRSVNGLHSFEQWFSQDPRCFQGGGNTRRVCVF